MRRIHALPTGFLSAVAFVLCAASPSAAAQDFEVTLRASRSVVEPEQTFAYTIQIRNVSGTNIEDADLSLAVDGDVKILSASGGGRRGGDGAQWRDLTFGAGQSRSFTVSAEVEDGAQDGDTLYATAVAGGGFAETTVQVENEDDENNDDDRRITIEAFADTKQVEPGEPFILKVAITNQSSRKVTGVEVTLETDERIEILSAANRGSASDGEITWTDIELGPYNTRTLSASARVDRTAQRGDVLDAIAYAEGAVYELRLPVWDPYAGRESMHIFISSDVREAEAGGTVSYTLKVRNMGNREGQVDVQAYIDPRTRFQSASENGEQFDATLVLWDRLLIEEDETKTLTLNVDVDPSLQPGAVLRFSAQAGIGRQELVLPVTVAPTESQNADRESARSSSSRRSIFGNMSREESSSSRRSFFAFGNNGEEGSASAPPNVILEMESDKHEATPGSLVTLYVVVKNVGEATAYDLEVEESFPAEMLTVRDVTGGGVMGNTVRWTIASLAAGAEWRGTYRARVGEHVHHGTTIDREAVVRYGEGQLGRTSSDLDVIEQLPQAGIGTYVLAAEQARRNLRTPLAQAILHDSELTSNAPNDTQLATPFRIPRIVWITMAGVGMLAGAALASRRQSA